MSARSSVVCLLVSLALCQFVSVTWGDAQNAPAATETAKALKCYKCDGCDDPKKLNDSLKHECLITEKQCVKVKATDGKAFKRGCAHGLETGCKTAEFLGVKGEGCVCDNTDKKACNSAPNSLKSVTGLLIMLITTSLLLG